MHRDVLPNTRQLRAVWGRDKEAQTNATAPTPTGQMQTRHNHNYGRRLRQQSTGGQTHPERGCKGARGSHHEHKAGDCMKAKAALNVIPKGARATPHMCTRSVALRFALGRVESTRYQSRFEHCGAIAVGHNVPYLPERPATAWTFVEIPRARRPLGPSCLGALGLDAMQDATQ